MKWWNNGQINKRAYESPGSEWLSGRKPFTRKPHSEETKSKIGKKLKGRVSTFKGKKHTDKTKALMSERAITNRIWERIDNNGRKPWNFGLTEETSISVKNYADKQRGQYRTGNYPAGENHHFYSLETDDYKRFKMHVRRKSERTYKKYKTDINPNNLKRGRNGEVGAYQLDHVIPIYLGYKQGLTVEELSCKENLCMITWEENIHKWWKKDYDGWI